MQRLPVTDNSHIAAARRGATVLSRAAGFDETDAGRLAIVVTELATNTLRHGGGGELLLGDDPEVRNGLQVVALDRGPGMVNVNDCLRDGFSTAGTPGNGLGAVQRLTSQLLIYSRPAKGTAVLARLAGRHHTPSSARRADAVLAIAKPGETACGDSAAIIGGNDGRVAILVADGLGHGPIAAAASQLAVRLFRDRPITAPAQMLAVLHDGLRPTRGAAIAVALIDPSKGAVLYGGIGNIAGLIADRAGIRRMVSHNGIAGHNAGTPRDFTYPLGERPTLIMHSDGMTTSWSPEAHPGLLALDPLLIAAVLYRDYSRGRDDTTVAVWKG